ncbi:hypothetical protein, conserved [Trypanosoma brucei gambiense DAL972]|uniref:ApaG domain-containing protein n=2 Tax=Trypanosoma brucei TaxID=5691 RepID=C9ZS08_TRYB9|nr:hypothetical protein, conserved [Trypanosoma brucei gambiense DAL972]RHW71567.1 hypothetical protein DPX39_070024000 [Trypanosoma brucei equiperdum]CBH12144.1 hypothetical protein, conserved [Trypanosoma brucei gambiense DAL972]|eukprot:XP_011774427.1 hypothetical protein, conserved [Trypanosoma brucei gambiense DAL972]
MSVTCCAYRRILKHLQRSAVRYGKQEEICFAVFGRALNMNDFAAAGYGETAQQVARSMFSRPSISGISCDEPAQRLVGAFDMLRRFAEVTTATGSSKVERSMDETERSQNEQKEPKGSGTTTSSGIRRAVVMDSVKVVGETSKPVSPGVKEDQANGGNGCENGIEDDEDQVTDGFHVGEGSVYIESSVSQKVRKISRRVLVCLDLFKIPPYRHMMPPEPLYPTNIRVRFKFPLMRDAMLCMAASVGKGNINETLERKRILNEEDYGVVCNVIPTRTITVTDHLEVELRTEYVLSRTYNSAEDDDEHMKVHPVEGDCESIVSGDDSGTNIQHIFRYFVFIRNYGPEKNEKKWHAQLLSRHLVIFDEEKEAVTEVIGPGLAGNVPLLPPGGSHFYESGLSLYGTSGVMRGTFQINTYNESGESRCIDIHIAPTRLAPKEGSK